MYQNTVFSLPQDVQKRKERERMEEEALKAQAQSAKSLEELSAELDRQNTVLQGTQDTLADHIKSYHKHREADAVQRRIDEEKRKRHEYKVAAFTVLLTLFLEHFFDLIKLANVFIELIFSLFS